MQKKTKNMMTTIFAIFVAMAFIGNAMAFGYEPPKIPFEGKELPMGEKMEFDKDTPIAIDMRERETHRFSFQWMFGKYSDHEAFTIQFNNTTFVDFKNYTDYDIPDIVDGGEIAFEYPATGSIKFIPRKITGDKPQLIITIERADNNTSGMDITISIWLFKMFLGETVEITHTVNVTAELTTNTIVIHIEHFSTQTLTAEGLGTPPDYTVMYSMYLIGIAGILFVIYAVIHYKYGKELLENTKITKIKKAIFWTATILLILGVVEYVYPII